MPAHTQTHTHARYSTVEITSTEPSSDQLKILALLSFLCGFVFPFLHLFLDSFSFSPSSSFCACISLPQQCKGKEKEDKLIEMKIKGR